MISWQKIQPFPETLPGICLKLAGGISPRPYTSLCFTQQRTHFASWKTASVFRLAHFSGLRTVTKRRVAIRCILDAALITSNVLRQVLGQVGAAGG